MNDIKGFNNIKELWQTYDTKLESIDAGNKNLIKHLLSQRASKRIQIMNYQSLAGAFIAPLLVLFIILPMGLQNEDSLIIKIGLSLIIFLFIIRFILSVIFISRINHLKIDTDPIIITQKKLLRIEQYGILFSQIRNLMYPFLAGGFILILWNNIPYTEFYKIIIFTIAVIGIYFWGKYKFKLYFKDKIDRLKIDIQELSDYK